MKKTITAAIFAAAMALGSTPSFAASSVGQITAFDFNTTGPAVVAGIGANYATVYNNSFTMVSANDYARNYGIFGGSASGASQFGMQKESSHVTAVSGGAAGGASFFGGHTAGSLTIANMINN